ncbi:unnamed protein product, partial [Oikopleura dioica]
MFDYGQCGCMSACEERQPKGQIVQYGNYKDAAKIVRSSRINVENMSAAVVYLAEVRGTVHEEVPDYGSEQFLSDVGGAAGLVLGMSLTSVIGLLGSGLHANLHLYKAMFRPKIRSDSRGYYPTVAVIATRSPWTNTISKKSHRQNVLLFKFSLELMIFF